MGLLSSIITNPGMMYNLTDILRSVHNLKIRSLLGRDTPSIIEGKGKNTDSLDFVSRQLIERVTVYRTTVIFVCRVRSDSVGRFPFHKP